jgi:hypothetical protein
VTGINPPPDPYFNARIATTIDTNDSDVSGTALAAGAALVATLGTPRSTLGES